VSDDPQKVSLLLTFLGMSFFFLPGVYCSFLSSDLLFVFLKSDVINQYTHLV